MDPLSFTASLIALSSLIGAFGKALKVIAQLKHADDEIANATNQLDIIQTIVDQLEFYEGVEEGQSPCSSSRAEFARIRGSILAATGSVVATARAVFPPSKSKSRRKKHIRQMKWIIKDRKAVETLQIKLNHLGSLLTIALQAEAANDNKYLAPAIASLTTKQELMYSHIVFIKDGLATLSEEPSTPLPSTPPPGDLQPASKRLMQACVMRSRFDIPGFMVQYYQSAGQRSHFSLLFGFKLPGAKVIFAKLSGPAYTLGIPSFRIKVQHMVPEDSEIFTACKAGNVLQVRDALQAKRASLNDITTRNETVLTAACDSRNTELVEFLLNAGASPNQTCGKMQTSPLHVAFELHELDIARRLLYYGADIDYTSARGWNVVHHLWQHQGVKEFSEYFFHMCSETGFSHPNTQDGSGWTCLHRAAAFGTARDVKALLKLGASLTMYTSQHAWTPIHVAAVMNNLSTLTALSVQVSAYTLHSPDAHGWTPLHLAVYREAEDTMRFLLNHGANPHAQTNITATWFPVGLEHQILCPVDLALNCGHLFFEKYVEALKDAGWQVTTSLDGEDVYWDSQEYWADDLPRYKKGSFGSSWNGNNMS